MSSHLIKKLAFKMSSSGQLAKAEKGESPHLTQKFKRTDEAIWRDRGHLIKKDGTLAKMKGKLRVSKV